MPLDKQEIRTVLGANLSCAILFSCHNSQTKTDNNKSSVLLDESGFETSVDGLKTDLYILKNANGMIATFTNLGGRLRI